MGCTIFCFPVQLELLHCCDCNLKHLKFKYFQLMSDPFFPPVLEVQRRILRSFSSLSMPAHFPSELQFLPTRSGETASRASLQSALRRPLPLLQLTLQTTQIHTQSLNPIHRCRPGSLAVWLRSYSIDSHCTLVYVCLPNNYAALACTCSDLSRILFFQFGLIIF